MESTTTFFKSKRDTKYSRSRHDGETHKMATKPRRQTRQTGALVRMLANANLLPVAVLVPPVLLS